MGRSSRGGSRGQRSSPRAPWWWHRQPTRPPTPGILKLFLDQIPTGSLVGVVAFPLMLGGAWLHALAPEVFLRPVLVELGATCPAKGLYLLDTDYIDPPGLDSWVAEARGFLR